MIQAGHQNQHLLSLLVTMGGSTVCLLHIFIVHWSDFLLGFQMSIVVQMIMMVKYYIRYIHPCPFRNTRRVSRNMATGKKCKTYSNWWFMNLDFLTVLLIALVHRMCSPLRGVCAIVGHALLHYRYRELSNRTHPWCIMDLPPCPGIQDPGFLFYTFQYYTRLTDKYS